MICTNKTFSDFCRVYMFKKGMKFVIFESTNVRLVSSTAQHTFCLKCIILVGHIHRWGPLVETHSPSKVDEFFRRHGRPCFLWGEVDNESCKMMPTHQQNTWWIYMDVSKNYGYPQIIHFNRVFHYKPSILGYPYCWKHPYISKIAGSIWYLGIWPHILQRSRQPPCRL